jgi:hypothetical protein
MERNLKSGLIAQAVILGLISAVIYLFLPDAGQSELKRMSAAIQNAHTWRVEVVVSEPTNHEEITIEFYCPTRYHRKDKRVYQEGGQQYEVENESYWLDGVVYGMQGPNLAIVGHDVVPTLSACTHGAQSADHLFDRMDTILATGKVRKSAKRLVNGEPCRDWIASTKAPDGWHDEFGACIGDADLPREIYTPDRQTVETYSEWNFPIRIEAPPTDETAPRGQGWHTSVAQ